MRKLIASTFVSLDGVMQAPGGPEEDPTGGFAFGGWTFNYWDEVMGRSMNGFDGKDRELVLGRRTYEIFEAYWPYQPADNPIAQTLNAAKKHVASRTLNKLQWDNSTLLQGDVIAAVAALKSEAGYDLQIIGSGNLIQTLQAASLIDEYNVWTFPVVLGCGKRLFDAGAKAGALRLVASQASTTGVVMSTTCLQVTSRSDRLRRPSRARRKSKGARSWRARRADAVYSRCVQDETIRRVRHVGVRYQLMHATGAAPPPGVSTGLRARHAVRQWLVCVRFAPVLFGRPIWLS